MKRLDKRIAFRLIELAIVIIIMLMLASFVRPSFKLALQRSRIERPRSDMRDIEKALEAYFADHRAYPLYTLNQSNDLTNPKPDPSTGTAIPILFSGNAQTAGLTTPIAYKTSLYRDPFAPEEHHSFAYYTDPAKHGWILFSPGPDRRYEIVPSEDYDSSITQPSAKLLLKAFDPTNGLDSAGDLYRVKQ